MVQVYCVFCKEKTNTSENVYKMSKNNKHMIQGKCTVCSKRKSQFISQADAKKGGFIFTVPAIAGAVGAISSLATGASAIANAVNKKKAEEKKIQEMKRHNKAMEKTFLGKSGKGLYLKPYKK